MKAPFDAVVHCCIEVPGCTRVYLEVKFSFAVVRLHTAKLVQKPQPQDIPQLHFKIQRTMHMDAEGKVEGFAAAPRAQEPYQELQSAG